MSRFAQLILAVIAMVLISSCTAKKCTGGPHDNWTDCGSHCPPTCENRYPGPCILSCNPSCQCDDGYLRNRNGQCVDPIDCYSDC